MADYGVLPAGQQRSALGGHWRQRLVADEIHASVHSVQIAIRRSARDRVAAEAFSEELGTVDDPLLARCQLGGHLSRGPGWRSNVTTVRIQETVVTFVRAWRTNVTIVARAGRMVTFDRVIGAHVAA